MSPHDAAKEILKIAGQKGGNAFITDVKTALGSYADAGIAWATDRGWIEVVGIGHYQLTDLGLEAAAGTDKR